MSRMSSHLPVPGHPLVLTCGRQYRHSDDPESATHQDHHGPLRSMHPSQKLTSLSASDTSSVKWQSRQHLLAWEMRGWQ